MQPAASFAQAAGGDPGLVNEFPVHLRVDAFRDESTETVVRFNIYFPVDEERYIPVNETLALVLSLPPEVDSDPGVDVRNLGTLCVPQELDLPLGLYRARVTGAVVSTRLAIIPRSDLHPGDYAVTLRFTAVDAAFRLLEALPPSHPATARLHIQLWASRQAKLDAEHQARLEAERRAREEAMRQAEEERRRQEALQAQRARRQQMWLRRAGVALAILALAAGPFLRYRRWTRPSVKVTVPAGGHLQQRWARPSSEEQRQREPGTILSTRWARDFLGRRRRIKVEALWTGTQIDLLISAGISVPEGRYLAGGRDDSVRIMVHGVQ